ncbi:hypothetical protein RDI58_010585 [Solanum bulbocastanum]|uniref:Uncharacterized protein n=1 Tax=Solanum bulbocastanum TaxID=147425 RepID=A0AAN8TPQ1_SOLBU
MPELNILLSYNKTKSMVKNLGLDYVKIDACPNDCMLFRNNHKDDEFSHTCGASPHIKNPKVSEVEPSKKSHRVSAKTLRHFPLIPRLKRLFMCSTIIDSLRWHDEEHSKDGMLRHPADGQARKDFDRLHLPFAQDSHNQHNLLRHNLDVMDVEKSIVDSILGILLDISGKTKDNAKARYDMKEMVIRKNLHLKDTGDNKRTTFTKTCFSMTNGEKSVFCGVLKTAKLPDGSASNISRYLHSVVQTKFNRRARNNDECDPSDVETVILFPKKGCPLGAKKTDPFILDKKSLSQAHAYLLGNCDEIQEYIREHEQEVNNHPRRSKWSKAKDHCQNFCQWFETRALQENVPNLIKELSRGPNFVTKRYSGYLINRYRFHIRQRDARHKTQNSGVIVVASTTSFTSSKDKNPIAADLTYYGRIVES